MASKPTSVPVEFADLPTPLAELIVRLTDALQETRVLAAVQNEGDPWYAEEDGLDAKAIISNAGEVILDAESFREGTSGL